MATAATYPKISRKLWWLLRDRFKKTVPSVVTPTLVMSLAPMADGSARSNVISPLRELGLLDEDNKPTEWATRWRHDDEYAAVCHEIRQKIYPSELIEAFPDADSGQKKQIKTWFMKVGHVGEAAARMYTDTYLLLSQADPAKPEEKTGSVSPVRLAKPKPKSKPKAEAKASAKSAPAPAPPTPPVDTHQGSDHPASTPHRRAPAIHIDVQVHISPDTSAEQIDRIFESMAKHLGTYIK
ncbi:DUF5343 domain-containing protein [Xylophilus sp. GW821-FHT01B05]